MQPDSLATDGQRSLVIVDDDDSGRRLLRRVLERRGYVVLEANNGAAGLDLIRTHNPRAALLDLRMPGALSGLDVLREVRTNAVTRQLPVVIVSASVQSDARDVALDLGAQAFIEKPIDFDELYAVLDRLLAPAH
ncbi:MAG: hypothetical protein JWN41_873 [Thermoleophilia bacterium]|nr:hypothetical protein [Thermoleophilia bacterium]